MPCPTPAAGTASMPCRISRCASRLRRLSWLWWGAGGEGLAGICRFPFALDYIGLCNMRRRKIWV